jgi:hypothetical protein
MESQHGIKKVPTGRKDHGITKRVVLLDRAFVF